jgi:hypothetical protein
MNRKTAVIVSMAAALIAVGALPVAAHGDLTCAQVRSGIDLRNWKRPYLDWLQEIDLRHVVCEEGRETYRAVLYEFHMSASAKLFRLEVWRDGSAAITVRATDLVMADKTPRLVFERTRLLTKDELASFREKFAASGFWALPRPKFSADCIPNGESVVEVVASGRYAEREVTPCDKTTPAMNDWFDEITRLDRSLPRP